MLRRLPATPNGPEPQPTPRTPLDEARDLGLLYGTLNQVAALVRLYAFATLISGSAKTAGGVLCPTLAALAASLARSPLHRLAGAWERRTESDEESSAFHQARLVKSQSLRAILQLGLTGLAVAYLDRDACGLSVSADAVGTEIIAAILAAATMASVWIATPRVLSIEPGGARLTMASGTHDLSSATEDELLRGMRPRWHAAYLAARCTCVALDMFSDGILFFIFLPCAVEGHEPPSSSVLYAGTDFPVVGVAASALCYGSQHLRWRGEWLLAAAFGLLLQFLCRHFGGDLLAPICAAMLFAAFRYHRRSQDVRRFHAQ